MASVDLQPRNILNRIQNETILADFEKAEFEHPCARKVLGNRIIYQSRALPLTTGMPVLCDFGEAVFGEVEHEHDIMPDAYRAPEVILDMKWNYQVDVWNVGVMVGYCILIHIRSPCRLALFNHSGQIDRIN